MKITPDEWERIDSREIADCRVFTVREDLMQNGDRRSTFFVIENPDWVNVIALTPEQNVVLVEQFRYGMGRLTVEIPGGMVDANEAPESAARRELAEETGFSSDQWIHLGTSQPNPALQNNVMHHFLAVDATKTESVKFDEHESLVTSLARLDEIPEMIRSGAISHSLVVSAFQYLSLRRS